MAWLRRPPARDRWLLGAIVLYGAGRLAMVAGLTPLVHQDTAGYFRLDFGGAQRLWTVPLLYTTVSDHHAIVVAQALVGVAAWGLLLWTVGRRLQRPPMAGACVAVLLLLGLTPHVVSWDAVLLSESLGASATVALVALALWWTRRPSAALVAATLVVLVLWTFTRQGHVLLLVTVLPFALVALAVARRWPLRLRAGLALFGCALTAWGVVAAEAGRDIATTNSFGVLTQRLLVRPSGATWFRAHGLPQSPDLQRAPVDERSWSRALAQPAMQRYLRNDFPADELGYLVRHPVFALGAPAYEAQHWLAGDERRRVRHVLPGPVASVLFGAGGWRVTVLWIGAWLIVLGLALARRVVGGREWVPIAGLAVCALWYDENWYLGPYDLLRLELLPAIAIRVLIVVSIGGLAQALLDRRRGG
jgi:hypothetical protein